MGVRLIPRNDRSRPMRAKYRICSIFYICIRIVSDLPDHFFCIMTFAVSFQRTKQSSVTACVRRKFFLISIHLGGRNTSFKHRHPIFRLRSFKLSAHPFYIRHCFSDIFQRQFHTKFVVRFKKNTFRLPKSLTYRTICCLPEITAFCMLFMRLSRQKRNSDICKSRTCQYSFMFPLFQMRKYQPLVITIQNILRTICRKLHPRSALSRL